MSMKEFYVVDCEENNDFYRDGQACSIRFLAEDSKIYARETINYFGEPVKYYYTICPNCGHLVCIDDKILTKEAKIKAEFNSEEYYIHEKNKLRGKLIHIDYMEKEEKKRIKKRTL